jgi:glycosyltransferase involved in cell wall biosynthesis
MKLSIIIPVYRTEATIDRCMESIVGQSFTDWEAILVDDGSPDACPQKCDEWCRRDSRIRVVHQVNGGLSDARNTGIEIAQGERLTFVDSDDYLDTDTYAQVMPLAEEHDIVEFPAVRFHGSPQASLLTFRPQVCTDQAHYWLTLRAYEHTYAWNKIYRRQLFDDIRFPKGKVFEDVHTLPRLMLQAHSIATTDRGLYYYCYNEQGITATADGHKLENLLEAHLAAMRQWCDDAYYLHVLNIQMDVTELTGQAPILTPRRVSILSAGLTWKQRLKALTLNTLGLEGICKLNKTIHRWTKHHS